MNLSFKTSEELFQFILLILLLGFTVILFFVVLNIFILLKKLKSGGEVTITNERLNEDSIWRKLTKAVPIAHEETVLLNHNFDGIRELDNHLPPWWLGLLYSSIVFAVVYLLNYHVWHWSPSQQEEYAIAMDEGKKEVEAYQTKLGESIDEKSVKLVSDTKTLENGKTIFVEKCVACHGVNGEGGVGPNLTDEYWLHGARINDIFGVIKNGVAEKGMISWKAILKPDQLQEVSNYILTLKGTSPEIPKAPQGQKASVVAVGSSAEK